MAPTVYAGGMQVDQIWRYPVKSMMGSTVDVARLDAEGIVGDRTWAVRDQVRGGIRGAKVLGGLMRLSARYTGDTRAPVEITLPDGRVVSTDEPDAAAAVSGAIDHEVTLEALRPADDLDHYRRGQAYHDDMMDELRSWFGRTEDEPLPDLSSFPPEIIEFESPPGTYYDAYPLMLMTTSALRALQEALPDSVIDVRRFRPSMVIDSGDESGHPEAAWVSRRLRIGETELSVVSACPRCVMVTREIDDAAPQDRAILRHVVRELDHNVGVYATIEAPGEVRTGDAVTLLD